MVAPKRPPGVYFSNCHGCQTFILYKIHCYLSPPKSWHNNSFLGSVTLNSAIQENNIWAWYPNLLNGIIDYGSLCLFLLVVTEVTADGMGGMPKRSSAPPTSRSSASPSSSSPGYSSRGPLSPYCAKIPELRSLTSKALGKSRSFWLGCSGNTIPELMGNPIPELTGYPIPELTGKLGRIPRDPIPHSQLGISLLNPESRPVQLLWKNK